MTMRTELVGLDIQGMDCPDCAGKLEKAVRRLSGVENAHVDFALGRLEVIFDPEQLKIESVIDRVEFLGYQAAVRKDRLLQSEPGPARARAFDEPTWRQNRFIWPTIIAGGAILAAVLAKLLSAPEMMVHALFLAGIALGGYLPARSGFNMLITARELDMNALMTMAAIGAVAVGEIEEGAVVVFLFALGNALESYTLDRSRKSIRDLMDLSPETANAIRDGLEIKIPVEQLQVGEMVMVRPGERIPIDGVVAGGNSAVNQASITGESMPVAKQTGDEVYAGTLNERGALDIRVSRIAQDTTLAHIIRLVEIANSQRAPSQQFVDRFSRIYTPAVMIAAVMVAIFPPLLLHQPFSKWIYEALAMLLVACPCALVISTPVSIAAAVGTAARHGVLMKGGAHLEALGEVEVVAFDKTGTLTTGEPAVTEVRTTGEHSPQTVVCIAAGLEYRSGHPLAEAIMRQAKLYRCALPIVEKFEEIPGKGVVGLVGGKRYYSGSTRFLREMQVASDIGEEAAAQLESEGKTVVLVGTDNQLMGIIALEDEVRSNSRDVIRQLRERGIKQICMLTGDNPATARAIADRIGVDEVAASLLPQDKAAAVEALLDRFGRVAMVGDGINDAPALATATVGIAMGAAGSDAALESADIALMADDLTRLPYAISLGRKTLRTIKQNIVAALIIKAVILSLVIPGWLTLWLAVLGDMGSTLLVTLNGMRLLRVKPEQE